MNGVIEARCNGAIFCSSELRLKSGEIEEDTISFILQVWKGDRLGVWREDG